MKCGGTLTWIKVENNANLWVYVILLETNESSRHDLITFQNN